MTAELKQCPFCGEDASVIEAGAEVETSDGEHWGVFCDAPHTCGAMIYGPSREAVIAQWNRRDDTVDLGALGRVRSVTDEEAALQMGITPEELRENINAALADPSTWTDISALYDRFARKRKAGKLS